jgi:hypothetical protein
MYVLLKLDNRIPRRTVSTFSYWYAYYQYFKTQYYTFIISFTPGPKENTKEPEYNGGANRGPLPPRGESAPSGPNTCTPIKERRG